MIKLDITMTATLRPEIISKTLNSIKTHIVGKDVEPRLIVNIDPIGEQIRQKDILKVIEKNFSNVIYNFPKEPSFAKAVRWVWQQSESDFIFHIEDDWIFSKKILVSNMINILNKYRELSSLRLCKYRIPNCDVFKMFDSKWRYNNDGFYVSDDWRRQFGLNPILIRRKFLDEVLPRMVDNVNPEKQFRESQEYMRDIIKKWKYAIYAQPGWSAVAIDIGRRWEGKKLYSKPKVGTFLTWVKNE